MGVWGLGRKVSQHVVNPVAQALPAQNGVLTPSRRIQDTDEPPAFSIAISSDGWTMASGSSDGSITLRRWQGDEGRFRRYLRMRHHKDWVCWVAFSRDGTFLVSAGRDCLVNVFDVRDRDKPAIVRVLKTAQCATSACFSADGREVVAGCADNDVYVWKVDRSPAGPPRRLKGHTDHVLSVATSPCQVQIASGSRDQTVRLWDSSGRPGPVLTGHEDCVNSVAFSPDGETLASGSADGTVRLWNVAKKKPSCVYTVKAYNDAEVYTLCFSPCGHLLASASARNLILVLADAAEDGPGVKKGIDKDAMRSAVFELDSWAGGKGSKAWKTPRELQRITDRELLVNSLGITPNREHLVASCRDGSVRMWNLRKQAGKKMARQERVLRDSHADVFAGTLGLNKNVLLREFRGRPERMKRLHVHYKSLARYPENPALQRVLESSLASEGDVLDVAFERPRTDAAQPVTLQAFIAKAAKSGGIELKYKYTWTLKMAKAIAHLHYEHLGISGVGEHGGISPRNVLIKAGKSEPVPVLALLERPTYVLEDQDRAERDDGAFQAPEVVVQGVAAVKKPADVWSFGALAYYMWTDGHALCDDRSPREEVASLSEGGRRTGVTAKEPPTAVIDLIRRCLSVDPVERPSMSSVLHRVESIVKGAVYTSKSWRGKPTTVDRPLPSSSGSCQSSESLLASEFSWPSPVPGLRGEGRESTGSGQRVPPATCSTGVSEPMEQAARWSPRPSSPSVPAVPSLAWEARESTGSGSRVPPGVSEPVEQVARWSPPPPSPPVPGIPSPAWNYGLSPHSDCVLTLPELDLEICELDLQDDTPLLELIAECTSSSDPSDWAEDMQKCEAQQLYTVGDLLAFARGLGSTERLWDQLKRLGVHPYATTKLCEYIEKFQPWEL